MARYKVLKPIKHSGQYRQEGDVIPVDEKYVPDMLKKGLIEPVRVVQKAVRKPRKKKGR